MKKDRIDTDNKAFRKYQNSPYLIMESDNYNEFYLKDDVNDQRF